MHDWQVFQASSDSGSEETSWQDHTLSATPSVPDVQTCTLQNLSHPAKQAVI